MTPQQLEGIANEVQQKFKAGDLAGAEAILRPHLSSGIGPIPLWRLLAQCIRPQGKIGETKLIQEMLVESFPGDLEARFDLSETLLLLGEFDRGWLEYRYRYSLKHTKIIDRKVQMPRWNGNPIPGKTLYIHDEQGYGDTFQFLRLVKQAKERSQARVVLEVNHESYPLVVRSLQGVVDQILPKGTIPPPFDLHCELMSLPFALKLQLSDLPGAIPYLLADPERVSKWAARLQSLPRPWVAICWAGRPTHFNDGNRSMKLDAWKPILETGASFISIQKGPAISQIDELPANCQVLNLDSEIQDFEDTAAILCLVDLLVSVDSSPIHLAGAISCPTWVMLPYIPDWRWLINREDSPWYPKHKLYRQEQSGNWSGVIERIKNDLLQLKAHFN